MENGFLCILAFLHFFVLSPAKSKLPTINGKERRGASAAEWSGKSNCDRGTSVKTMPRLPFFCQLSSQLWSLPGIFLLEIVCEFSHFQESWDVAMSALLGTRPSNSCTFCKKHYLSLLTLLTHFSLVFVTNSLSNIDFWLCKLVKQAWKQARNSFFIIGTGELYCTQCNSKRRSIKHVL